jgi:flagellar protein FlbD
MANLLGNNMIKVTKLNDEKFYLNPHLIEFIEKTPDTVVRMMSDRRIIVKETPEEIRDLIIHYRRAIGLMGNDTPL